MDPSHSLALGLARSALHLLHLDFRLCNRRCSCAIHRHGHAACPRCPSLLLLLANIDYLLKRLRWP